VLAKQDIKDAIDYCLAEGFADRDNVFILGLSGGGHMTLLMAGYCPDYFKAAAAFVPITDLQKWTEENAGYKEHVLACCEEDTDEMLKRSPIYYLDTIAKCNLKIFHGKFDPVVPMSHSFSFYGKLIEKYPDAHVYLDIFDGGHEIDMEQAMYWLYSQYNGHTLTEVTG
jgi:dipeptidyl aminopeptidase/acylaminoacyl peptidase